MRTEENRKDERTHKRQIRAQKRTEKARNQTVKTPDTKRLRLGNLKTIAGIAKFERRIVRLAMRTTLSGGGALSINDAYKLAAVCGTLVKTLEVGELSDRLTAIEKRLDEREGHE